MLRIAVSAVLLIGIVSLCLPVAAGSIITYDISNFVTAPTQNAPGYGFAFDSDCQSPGTDDAGNTYYDWWYSFYLENDSTNHRIMSWIWAYGGATGPIMPGVHEWINVSWASNPFPLAAAPDPNIINSTSREEDFSDFAEKVTATSTITWDDGHAEQVQVYIPSNAATSMVPEPGAMTILAGALLGLVGFLRRRA